MDDQTLKQQFQTTPILAPIVRLETLDEYEAVNGLVHKIFGPGRLVKTAQRLRDGSKPYAQLSLVVEAEGVLQAALRLWPIKAVKDDGEVQHDLAFLGPICVEFSAQNQGFGTTLVNEAIKRARTLGLKAIVLVGPQSYFGRFGFEVAQGVSLPGPVDPKRLLVLYLTDGYFVTGKIEASRS